MRSAQAGCPDCGTPWRRGAWHYCGACGRRRPSAPAPDATKSPGSEASPRNPPRGDRAARRASGLVAATVVAVATGLLVTPGDGPLPTGGEEVHLPSDVADRGDETPGGAPSQGPPPHIRPCDEGDCDLWRAQRGGGSSLYHEGVVFHAVHETVSAVSALHGRILWERPIAGVTDGRPGSVVVLGASDGMVLTLADQTVLQARSTADGRPLWSSDLEGLRPDAMTAVPDGLLLMRRATGDASRRVDTDAVARLDAADGALLWAHEVDRLLGRDPGYPIVAQVAEGEAAAIDPVSGEWIWRRRYPPDRLPHQDGERVVLPAAEGLAVLDARSGETLALMPHAAPRGSRLHVHGELVALSSPSPEATPVDSSEHVTVSLLRPGEDALVGRARGVPAGMLVVEDLLVTATRTRSSVVVDAYDREAAHRWRHVHDVPDDSCCWWLEPVDDTSLLVATRRPGSGHAVRLEAATGQRLERFRVRGEADEPGQLQWHGTLAVHHTGAVTRLLGSAGTLEMTGPVRVVSAPRPLVLDGDRGLLRIDERLVVHTGVTYPPM